MSYLIKQQRLKGVNLPRSGLLEQTHATDLQGRLSLEPILIPKVDFVEGADRHMPCKRLMRSVMI